MNSEPLSHPGAFLDIIGSVRITLNEDRCTGHGRCYSLAPELSDADDMGHCVVLHAEVPAGLEEKAALAINSCPEDALSAGGQ